MNKLINVDVNEHTEEKGKFTYLSWAFAVSELIKAHPDATWEVKRFPMIVSEFAGVDPESGEVFKNTSALDSMLVPYMRTDAGYFVEVEVTVDGVSRSQIHPVLNHQNKPIASPTSFEINTAIQRALAKAIALQGLGLYIYAGEDLPPSEPHRFKPKEKNSIRDAMLQHLQDGDEQGVAEILSEYTQGDPEESMKFWALFSSTERSTIKAMTGEAA